MKHHIQDLLTRAIEQLQQDASLPAELSSDIQIEHSRGRGKEHGDYASNIALMLAKAARCNPRQLAERITDALPQSSQISRVEIAGPGFINFFVTSNAFQQIVVDIHNAGEAFGRSTIGNGQVVQVEFVSANPTGPLHVGHGRGAAYGAAVADLLVAAGFKVHREYYVNDAGRQMDILAASVWLRYLEQCGEAIVFPSNGYRGDYVRDIAATIHNAHGNTLRHPAQAVMENLPADANKDGSGGDKEAHIDALIARAKQLLGNAHYRTVFDAGVDTILHGIREDLEMFGVVYEAWFSERELVESGAVERAIERLKKSDKLYERDGAWWFRSSQYGDEKDRVVVRENGETTYFASDIAYHMNKLERGFERTIDIWGADHHGYVPRIKAALQALGEDPKTLDVLLVQFAILYRGGEKMQMSTRSGEFVTLRELCDEVGRDAARFFYVMRKCEQHMDFDLELAKSQSNDNPVYYVQYAHARICSVMRQQQEKGLDWQRDDGFANLEQLSEPHEQALMSRLSRYPQVIENSALNHEPHQLAYYLRELATEFHTYYNAHQFLVDDSAQRNARIALITAVGQVLRNGLALLGVTAAETM
ncbi:MAG: arginine--tRNA ligase [Gammaproteobacteria bacterium]|nr:arginine--tRNA ligase [Gammaproteobacteria bacterium]